MVHRHELLLFVSKLVTYDSITATYSYLVSLRWISSRKEIYQPQWEHDRLIINQIKLRKSQLGYFIDFSKKNMQKYRSKPADSTKVSTDLRDIISFNCAASRSHGVIVPCGVVTWKLLLTFGVIIVIINTDVRIRNNLNLHVAGSWIFY